MTEGKRNKGDAMPPSIQDKSLYIDVNDPDALADFIARAKLDPKVAAEAQRTRERVSDLENADALIVASGFRDPAHYRDTKINPATRTPCYCKCGTVDDHNRAHEELLRQARNQHG